MWLLLAQNARLCWRPSTNEPASGAGRSAVEKAEKRDELAPFQLIDDPQRAKTASQDIELVMVSQEVLERFYNPIIRWRDQSDFRLGSDSVMGVMCVA
jgi:hypothetical protein